MATLTSADMVQLEKYASSGDRYNYWKFLSNKGDRVEMDSPPDD